MKSIHYFFTLCLQRTNDAMSWHGWQAGVVGSLLIGNTSDTSGQGLNYCGVQKIIICHLNFFLHFLMIFGYKQPVIPIT